MGVCRLEILSKKYSKEILELFAPIPCPYCGVYHEKDGYTRMYKGDKNDETEADFKKILARNRNGDFGGLE